MSRRRSALALVAAGGLCLLSVGVPLVAAQAADAAVGSGLGSFQLNAASPGLELTVGEPNFCFTNAVGTNGCEGVIPEAVTSLAYGPIGNASAEIAWPGELAANAGSLLITAGGSSVPTSAEMLNDPVRAQVKTGQTPDTVSYDSVPNVTMKAVAKDTSTSADAAVQDLSVAAVGTVGSIAGHSSTYLSGVKEATSKAMSQVSDINLAAGVVHIGGITSTAVATTDGTTAKVKGSTTVTGATIAGIPVTIDQNGVSVMGSGVALSAATNAVNSALKNAGLTLLVSEPQGKPIGPGVVYTSGSLVAVFNPPASQASAYHVSLSLGGANVTATAGQSFGYVPPPFGGTTTGGTTTGGSSTTTTTGGGGGSTSTSGSGGTSVAPPLSSGTTGGSTSGATGATVPNATVINPTLEASHASFGFHGLSPWLWVVGVLGTSLMVAGLKRLPDRVLEASPTACPLEES